MKGNIYIYAMFIVVLAAITVVLVQFMHGFVPGQEAAREGNMIRITQFSFGFTPNYIELKKGESVMLKVKSAGGNHNFVLDQYSINTFVGDGKEVSIPLTADLEGEFLFYDNLPGHNESGENGLLVVKP